MQFLSSHDIPATSVPLVHAGSPADVLLEQSSALEARLIVMGSYGGWQLKELLLGSVAQRLLRESTVPVFSYH